MFYSDQHSNNTSCTMCTLVPFSWNMGKCNSNFHVCFPFSSFKMKMEFKLLFLFFVLRFRNWLLVYFLRQPLVCYSCQNIISGFQVFFLLVTGSVHILTVKTTGAKIKIQIPFSNVTKSKDKTQEVWIPFFNEAGKWKTKMKVQMPFSHAAGKR